MLQAKLLAEQLLTAVRELVDEIKALRRELAAHKTTGGE
jgi:hypothetical protein